MTQQNPQWQTPPQPSKPKRKLLLIVAIITGVLLLGIVGCTAVVAS